ncbi:MAG: hypothetical protein HOV68_20950, partial [Streptomycetaceae bacterium]|nr:hypothetical protein [Streptomycetaceae bacterium]
MRAAAEPAFAVGGGGPVASRDDRRRGKEPHVSTTREPYRAWQLPPQDKPGAGGETSASGKSGEPGLDVTRPHPARIYNYLLDGTEHFAADREAAEQIIAASPGARPSARGNRVFLRRAVRYLVRRGVRQFLDIGTGIPTVGNSHEVAQELAPDARVVYADNYPIVLALDYAPSLMRSSVAGRTAYIQADVRDPKSILSDPQVRAVIDFDLPVAVLLVAVLHFVRDEEDPAALVAELRDALAPGSHVVVSHVSGDFDPERARTAAQV